MDVQPLPIAAALYKRLLNLVHSVSLLKSSYTTSYTTLQLEKIRQVASYSSDAIKKNSKRIAFLSRRQGKITAMSGPFQLKDGPATDKQ